MKVKIIEEECKKCGRGYDGAYPCPCGCKEFIELGEQEE